MARLDINKPYQDFLQAQVDAGLFRSITAAAKDAIRNEMIRYEERRVFKFIFRHTNIRHKFSIL